MRRLNGSACGVAICIPAMLAFAGCGAAPQESPGEMPTFDAIGEDEVINLLGTEPFWSARIEGSQMTYSTPENIEGEIVEVRRFAGNNGLGFSGSLNGQWVQVAVTPGQCLDQMSDRSYPFTATIGIGQTTKFGCAYSDRNPYSSEEND